jgi:MFS transporter, putative metabolite:H+ symporter
MSESPTPASMRTLSIEQFVGAAMDDAKLSPVHYWAFALITAGLFFDVSNFIVFGVLVPDMLQTHFATRAEVASIGFATAMGLFLGSIAQGQFTDRFGRKAVYQFNLLVFGIFTIAGAFAPNYLWLSIFRFIAGVGLGAELPLCFAYAGEYAPKRIRGRILACIQLIGGAIIWPISTLFALFFLKSIGWQGIWLAYGIGALVVFVLRFSFPESPRWLATHGRGERALEILGRIGIARPGADITLVEGAASRSRSDPFLVVFRDYPGRVIASSICFIAFFGVAVGLGAWLPNIIAERGLTITKTIKYTLLIQIAYPSASIFMMFALERFGRKPVAIIAFFLAGVFAFAFIKSPNDSVLLLTGFWMAFFTQLAGNSAQIFSSEVFPTNARASGFGIASGMGRLAVAFIIPTILWIQNGFGVTTVFACVALLLVIAAFSVNWIGPEARGVSLDVLAPPTA